MRIGVIKRPMAQQDTACCELFDNRIVSLEDMLTFKHRRSRQINTVAADWVIDLKSIILADLEVLQTMCRRRVHAAGTRIGRYMISQHDRHRRAIKRRDHHDTIEGIAFDLC